ncbi:DUF808 domain-containing protein [Methylobacterium iners]|uniref:Inner membrane protein YedI n=1 Tax=Methylobacterium iners TaxID=418707 RepID=A0ABQ4RY08_9HYPH|nr:DUF808 domain-containing protein [Methylobacterium iners]GJD94862.1 Inner membrane protein YedI [Methylobacterium iners]
MSIGLIAILDDVAALAKLAAASLDDVAAQSAKAGTKALGIVIDDTAVTPRYVVGFAASRELPIIGRIAMGSLKNKFLFLLPGALALSYFAPAVITPLLMLGGIYLCYEGAEKVLHALAPHQAEAHEQSVGASKDELQAQEDARIRGAIQTDFILSAEVMALTLASLNASSVAMQATILAVVALGVTLIVYGFVALIVKADDAGVALATNARPASSLLGMREPGPGAASGADRAIRSVTRGIGRGLVAGMPYFLKVLAVVGTAAMLWVGGGIILHGLEEFAIKAPGHLVHDAAAWAAAALPSAASVVEWMVTAALSGVLGLILGGLTIPVAQFVIAPISARIMGLFRPKAQAAKAA